MKRGAQYYLRKRIPTELVKAYGKEKDPFIVYSLKTADFNEACKRLRIELGKLEHDFEAICTCIQLPPCIAKNARGFKQAT